MKWFRMWTDILDDPKCNVSSMSDETFRLFVSLMAYASELDFGGVIDHNLDTIAWRLRTDVDRLKKHISTLKGLGILTDDSVIVFKNWEKRQPNSDNSTERVKRFRNKQRNVSETASETAPDTDSDTDSDSEGFKDSVPPDKKTPEEPEPDQKDQIDPLELFNQFWAQYPRKDKKVDALKAWKQIKKLDEVFDSILYGLAKAKMSQQWNKDRGQFIPLPATWIRARQWDDQGVQGDFADSPPSKKQPSRHDENMAVAQEMLSETRGGGDPGDNRENDGGPGNLIGSAAGQENQ